MLIDLLEAVRKKDYKNANAIIEKIKKVLESGKKPEGQVHFNPLTPGIFTLIANEIETDKEKVPAAFETLTMLLSLPWDKVYLSKTFKPLILRDQLFLYKKLIETGKLELTDKLPIEATKEEIAKFSSPSKAGKYIVDAIENLSFKTLKGLYHTLKFPPEEINLIEFYFLQLIEKSNANYEKVQVWQDCIEGIGCLRHILETHKVDPSLYEKKAKLKQEDMTPTLTKSKIVITDNESSTNQFLQQLLKSSNHPNQVKTLTQSFTGVSLDEPLVAAALNGDFKTVDSRLKSDRSTYTAPFLMETFELAFENIKKLDTNDAKKKVVEILSLLTKVVPIALIKKQFLQNYFTLPEKYELDYLCDHSITVVISLIDKLEQEEQKEYRKLFFRATLASAAIHGNRKMFEKYLADKVYKENITINDLMGILNITFEKCKNSDKTQQFIIRLPIILSLISDPLLKSEKTQNIEKLKQLTIFIAEKESLTIQDTKKEHEITDEKPRGLHV